MKKNNMENRRENGLLSLNVDMNALLKSFGRRDFSVVDIIIAWEQIVGAETASHLKPVSLKSKILALSADSSGLAMEVSSDRMRLLGRINTFFGKEVVNGLKVTAAPRESENEGKGEGDGTSPPVSLEEGGLAEAYPSSGAKESPDASAITAAGGGAVSAASCVSLDSKLYDKVTDVDLREAIFSLAQAFDRGNNKPA